MRFMAVSPLPYSNVPATGPNFNQMNHSTPLYAISVNIYLKILPSMFVSSKYYVSPRSLTKTLYVSVLSITQKYSFEYFSLSFARWQMEGQKIQNQKVASSFWLGSALNFLMNELLTSSSWNQNSVLTDELANRLKGSIVRYCKRWVSM